MTYRVYLDQFSSLDELKPRERKDDEAVLSVLRRAKRFSVWEHKDTLYTIMRLSRDGRIRLDTEACGYPWTLAEVLEPVARSTDKGKQ